MGMLDGCVEAEGKDDGAELGLKELEGTGLAR